MPVNTYRSADKSSVDQSIVRGVATLNKDQFSNLLTQNKIMVVQN